MASIAAVAIIALLAGAIFASHRAGSPASQIGANPTKTAKPASPQSTQAPASPRATCTPGAPLQPVNASGTSNGITLYVNQAYADPTRTLIVDSTSYKPTNQFQPFLQDATLTDANGNVYQDISSGGDGRATSFDDFEPLAEADLSAPQTLTLSVRQIMIDDSKTISGNWNVTFAVTPHVGHLTTFHVAPVTKNGVTVQPLSLETFTSGGNLPDQVPCGATLFIQITGLTPGIRLDSFTISYTSPGGAGFGGRGAKLTLNDDKPADYVYRGADGKTPNNVVGPSGKVILEVLMWTPPPQAGFNTPPDLEQIAYSPSQSGNLDDIEGPWNFELPIS